ncbi:hypothetical protein BG003_003795 [Podila horticola]|nr:hypothetical protein BG003_003795 [Podila horticola]
MSYPQHSTDSNDASERTPLISNTSPPPNARHAVPPTYTSGTSSSSYVAANNQLDRSVSPTNSSVATITSSRVATTSPVSTPSPTTHRKSNSTDTLPVSAHPPYYDDGERGGYEAEDESLCRAGLESSHLSIRELSLREFKILLRYSGPVILTYVLQNSMQLASLVSLGHLGSIGKRHGQV